MQLTIALAQSGFPKKGDAIAQAERYAEKAAAAGAQLLVFPENFMLPGILDSEGVKEISEPLGGPFARAMADIALRHHLWIVYVMFEENPDGGQPFNTAVTVDAEGVQRGAYRKCHLYDAHGVLESDRSVAGDQLPQPIDTPFGPLGVAICYDLRFPEVARALAVAGCKLVLFPSAWNAGPRKVKHWTTLLRARAIENELFVAGICHAGKRYTGKTLVADPLGRIVASARGSSKGNAPQDLVICTIDTDAVESARDAMPVLDHRRPELYAS
ncbi:carbon-nitrogen hydrolase family protein [Slackia heliotrinireducens]|uniref:carbon-nitrogen hydrolase family protein n=1 Tax=Slackia heliotrinireducens TaxID=84110 RepID=UPI003314984A